MDAANERGMDNVNDQAVDDRGTSQQEGLAMLSDCAMRASIRIAENSALPGPAR